MVQPLGPFVAKICDINTQGWKRTEEELDKLKSAEAVLRSLRGRLRGPRAARPKSRLALDTRFPARNC